MNPFSLKGKVAFISGSTRGIGWSTAQVLAENGATIILNGHSNPDLLQQRIEHIKNTYQVPVTGFIADFADSNQIWKCYSDIFKTYGSLDIVVNNAGIMKSALLGMITDDMINESFNVNTIGVLNSTQFAAKLMMRKKRGSIINLSSILGVQGFAGQTVYAASKSAVIGLTKAAAKELAPHNIRVNCIAPGFIDTDMTADIPKDVSNIKMGRIGKPEDVANAILFLASSLSEYVTGQVIGVDGGMII